MARVVNIEDDVIVGRAYKMYNSIDNYVYIDTTTLPLTKRLGDHMYEFNQGIKSQLYDHMRKIDLQYWTIKLLEARFVDNISELSQMEKKWINKENPQYILNIENANKTDKYNHKIYMIADKIIKPILDELLDEVINEISHIELTNSNESEN